MAGNWVKNYIRSGWGLRDLLGFEAQLLSSHHLWPWQWYTRCSSQAPSVHNQLVACQWGYRELVLQCKSVTPLSTLFVLETFFFFPNQGFLNEGDGVLIDVLCTFIIPWLTDSKDSQSSILRRSNLGQVTQPFWGSVTSSVKWGEWVLLSSRAALRMEWEGAACPLLSMMLGAQ